MIDTVARGRARRTRAAPVAWAVLPAIGRAQRELLVHWLRSDTEQRRCDTLRRQAGADRLELADALLEQLLAAGVLQVDERFAAGRWWPVTVSWIDLPRLQAALGLPTRMQREASRAQLEALLRAMASDPALHEALRRTADELSQAQLAPAVRGARAQLLDRLAQWHLEQRRGLRQDFALYARPHTKAVSEAEWRWLDDALDLQAFGVERFAATLWLAAEMQLSFAGHRIDLSAAPFIGLPQEAFDTLSGVQHAPRGYWLIENRASFERQARRREPGRCIVWLAGRPSPGWRAALDRLLLFAPAPASVSADADPAGIEIAVAAGAIWQQRDCEWSPLAMEAERLNGPRCLPLNDYDRQTLERLSGSRLPAMLHALADAMQRHGAKAEQEGWL